MDRISIRGLRAVTHIGVPDEERSRPQALLIDLEVLTDLRQAGASDELDDTVDYGALTSRVAELVSRSRVKLLERLAALIAEEIATAKGVTGVSVTVAKETPPLDEDVKGVSVQIERT